MHARMMSKKRISPYPYSKITSPTGVIYIFTTDQQVRYIAHFSDYRYMFGTPVLNARFYAFDPVVDGSQVRPQNILSQITGLVILYKSFLLTSS